MRALLLCAALLPAAAGAVDSSADFARKVTEFTLPNGLHWIVIERHMSPVVSIHTYVGAGSVDVPAGQTGLATVLAREAWEGTETIGSKDAAAEKKALAQLEEAADRLSAERAKGSRANDATVLTLQIQYRMAFDQAQAYALPGEYQRRLAGLGVTGLKAAAGADSIEYSCTLPSNQMETWFSMEAQRLSHPVFRNFYAERDRLVEELRGPAAKDKEESRLLDQVVEAAFVAHPYRNPPEGWPGDVEHLRMADAAAFFARYFIPGNITIALAGDVSPADARRLAERYFGSWAARPAAPVLPTQEPPQTGPRTFLTASTSAPMMAIAYKRPDQYNREDSVFDLLDGVLGAGQNSWLSTELMQQKGAILRLNVRPTFPGGRDPHLFVIILSPAPGHTLDEIESAWAGMVGKLQNQPLDAGMLARSKALVRASVLERLERNADAAELLASASANYGSWQAIFRELDNVEALTAADLQRVALKYLVVNGRTVAYSGMTGPGTAVPQPGAQK